MTLIEVLIKARGMKRVERILFLNSVGFEWEVRREVDNCFDHDGNWIGEGKKVITLE